MRSSLWRCGPRGGQKSGAYGSRTARAATRAKYLARRTFDFEFKNQINQTDDRRAGRCRGGGPRKSGTLGSRTALGLIGRFFSYQRDFRGRSSELQDAVAHNGLRNASQDNGLQRMDTARSSAVHLRKGICFHQGLCANTPALQPVKKFAAKFGGRGVPHD